MNEYGRSHCGQKVKKSQVPIKLFSNSLNQGRRSGMNQNPDIKMLKKILLDSDAAVKVITGCTEADDAMN